MAPPAELLLLPSPPGLPPGKLYKPPPPYLESETAALWQVHPFARPLVTRASSSWDVPKPSGLSGPPQPPHVEEQRRVKEPPPYLRSQVPDPPVLRFKAPLGNTSIQAHTVVFNSMHPGGASVPDPRPGPTQRGRDEMAHEPAWATALNLRTGGSGYGGGRYHTSPICNSLVANARTAIVVQTTIADALRHGLSHCRDCVPRHLQKRPRE